MSHENSKTVEIDGRFYLVRGADVDAGLPNPILLSRKLAGPYRSIAEAGLAAQTRSRSFDAQQPPRGDTMAGYNEPQTMQDIYRQGLGGVDNPIRTRPRGRPMGDFLLTPMDLLMMRLDPMARRMWQAAGQRYPGPRVDPRMTGGR